MCCICFWMCRDVSFGFNAEAMVEYMFFVLFNLPFYVVCFSYRIFEWAIFYSARIYLFLRVKQRLLILPRQRIYKALLIYIYISKVFLRSGIIQNDQISLVMKICVCSCDCQVFGPLLTSLPKSESVGGNDRPITAAANGTNCATTATTPDGAGNSETVNVGGLSVTVSLKNKFQF